MKKIGSRFDREPSAEDVLNGIEKDRKKIPYTNMSESSFHSGRLVEVPAPGIHPRILCSPAERADIQRRTQETETGRLLIANLRWQNEATILKDGTWENKVYNTLQTGDIEQAEALLEQPSPSIPEGHYQPHILYALVKEALDAWISEDRKRGEAAAAAIAGYASLLAPKISSYRSGPFGGHASRWGSWHALGSYELFGFQHLGYAYDFAFEYMSEEQRSTVRRVIADITQGAISQGMELPAHWRNWNWMNCSNCFVLLSLAIEGEDGYDPRVYARGVEVMEDYLTYGISPQGSSTEAVGYTGFGWVWGVPAMMAMARRGEKLFLHQHFVRYTEWLLHTMQPYGKEWISHGDGGDGGPGPHLIQMLKYYCPDDPVIDELWHNALFERGKDQRQERMHLIEAILCAADGDALPSKQLDSTDEHDHDRNISRTTRPITFFDPDRGSMIARNNWTEHATVLQFECRPDTLTPSHEHADRGNFSFTSLGVKWVGEAFRSVETKYHSCVLIDGKGQGYFPPPGEWLDFHDSAAAAIGICDAKYAYDWFWPKTIAATSPNDDERFLHERWSSFKEEAAKFERIYGDLVLERDPLPHVTEHFQGWVDRDPRYWDEDGWPVRVPHNPVQRAFRTAGIVRGERTYAFIADDIRKDDKERLYEWTMMLSMDIDVFDITGQEIHLFSRSHSPKGPQAGDPMLLVRILELGLPARARDFETAPAVRLETFEKKDTFNDTHALYKQGGGRSFGLDRRLIIPSRSVEPAFKVLLIPYRYGDTLPDIHFDAAASAAIIEQGGTEDRLVFSKPAEVQPRTTLYRNGIIVAAVGEV